MLPTPGLGEVIFIALMVLVVFWGEKIGVLGDAIGRARKEFRRAQTEDKRIDARPTDKAP